ncbi:integumentary mucin C.1-like [Anopheles marshallii]|uniref:integumentary mucin C.1-like n=1 Tax=Anopheles marshallii TaxID=1521116 RepID=UPI00237B374E|nr:integumentary mucin C.1-like [Anopheles marshallii]
MARIVTLGVLLVICLGTVHPQLVCYQCDDCELQQEIPVVCGDTYFTTTSPPDTTCPTCAPEPTLPTTPEWTTSTPDTTCPTCAPTLPTTPIPTTSTPDTTCPTCAPTLPTTPIPTTSTPDTTCPTCAPTLPTSPIPTTSTPEETTFHTSTPDTTCPTCAPTLPTTHPLTTSTPTMPPPTPTTPTPTTPTPTTPTPPSCPAGCCPCYGARSTSIFAMAAKATKNSLMDEFEDDIRSPRQLPLPVYVCYTTERFVNQRRVISRGCTKRQQSLTDTCTQLSGGQPYEQCSLCSWQLCNR